MHGEDSLPVTAAAAPAAIVEIENLSKHYGRTAALDSISLSAPWLEPAIIAVMTIGFFVVAWLNFRRS
jgi:hypothetical protein